MDVADFLVQLDQLFELDPGTLNLTSVLDDIPGWSSLTFLGLIALVDEEYNVALKPRQLLKCATVGDLVSVVSELNASVATS